jgi:hypothetical protein
LGSYHVWPCRRALVRLRYKTQPENDEVSVLGGPFVHLLVHVICLGLFVYAGVS